MKSVGQFLEIGLCELSLAANPSREKVGLVGPYLQHFPDSVQQGRRKYVSYYFPMHRSSGLKWPPHFLLVGSKMLIIFQLS